MDRKIQPFKCFLELIYKILSRWYVISAQIKHKLYIRKGRGLLGKDVGKEVPLSLHGGPINLFKDFGKKEQSRLIRLQTMLLLPMPNTYLVEWW